MAWNESFANDGGWGASETSFVNNGAAAKDSASKNIADRLPVPVTISTLVETATPDEKYVLGTYSFGTVCTVGVVKSYNETENTTTYIVYDPEDESKEYNVISYHGVSDDNNDVKGATNIYVEGTRIMATGKLRNLNRIITFDVKENSCDKEYESFKLEAKIAEIYFANDVFHKLQHNQADNLTGYCIGAPAVNANAPPTIGSNAQSAFSSQQSRIYPQTTSSSMEGSNKQFGGLKGRILEVLEKSGCNDNGMSIDDIRSTIGGGRDIPVIQVRNELEYLISEGHIYNTINDDYFALINNV